MINQPGVNKPQVLPEPPQMFWGQPLVFEGHHQVDPPQKEGRTSTTSSKSRRSRRTFLAVLRSIPSQHHY